jgi:hypothetical protein
MRTVPESTVIGNPLFRALVCQLKALSRSLLGEDASFSDVEVNTLQVTNLAIQEQLQQDLQRRADELKPELLIDGRQYRRHAEGTDTYHSLNGPLSVRRCTYREVGVRNGPTVVPLELLVGVVEGATPALGYSVTLGYAQGELRSYLESMEAAHRCPPSRSTLERMAKAIGSEARKEAPRIEAVLRKKERLPKEAHGLSMGLDRVAVPMEEDREEGAAPKTRRRKRTKPYERSKPHPVDVSFHMAYVGTVSVVDAYGEELVTRRYTALPDAEPDEVVDKLMADVRNALRQNDALPLSILQDGAPELWNAMKRGLKKVGVKDWYEGIDRYHLNERLGAALHLVEPNAQERTRMLSDWNDDLDASDQAIDRIQRWMGAQIPKLEKMKDDNNLNKYLGHLIYIENNQDRMRYATLKHMGLPVGSGLTEGACKSVVGQRTCGSGQRWRPEGIAAVLTLRATHRSDRLPLSWTELSKNYTAKIRPAA